MNVFSRNQPLNVNIEIIDIILFRDIEEKRKKLEAVNI
jgi:hypothetical protein